MAISSSSCDSVAFGIETAPCISQICPNVTSQLPWWLNVYWCRTALLAYHTGLTVTSKMLLSLCGVKKKQKRQFPITVLIMFSIFLWNLVSAELHAGQKYVLFFS